MTHAQRAFAQFTKGQVLTANQLAERMGWNRTAASKQLAILTAQRRIQRRGETWPPIYEARPGAPAFPSKANPTTVAKAIESRPALQAVWSVA